MSPLLLMLALDARQALDAGDAAWMAGDRGQAKASWKEAAEAEDPAVRAMAELRLLRVSGNLGWMVHGPRADDALIDCPARDPWCDLAEADLDLTLRDLGLGGDVEHALHLTERAAASLPGPAAARQAWAAQPWPSGPGTWALGLGVIAGPGLGVGGALRLVQPDLGWRAIRLELSAVGTSRGAGSLGLSWRTPGAHPAAGSLGLSRSVVDLYEDGARRSLTVDQVSATATPILRRDRLAVYGGPLFRLDREQDWQAGHGVLAGASLDLRTQGLGPYARASGELSLADYAYGRATLDLRESLQVGPPVLAARLLLDAVPLRDEDTPAWRLPAVGGADVLRGAPAGYYRGEALAAGALELRQGLGPTWELVAFGEAALVAGTGGLHPGGGLGVRARLPPRPDNTVRLDLGFTDGGWGLVAGWGETF